MPKARDLTTNGRREQILDEALRLFVAHGAQNVSTRHIARAVGISQPSLYAHFPNRDAIAVELCCRAFGELRNRLLGAISGTDMAPVAHLRAIGRTYIEFGLDNAAAYQIAFMLDLPPEATPEKSKVLMAGVNAFAVLRNLFGPAISGQADRDIIAQSTWASMHGLVALLIARSEIPWADTNRLVETHLDGICLIASPYLKG